MKKSDDRPQIPFFSVPTKKNQAVSIISWINLLFQSGSHVGHRPLKVPPSRLWYPSNADYLVGEREGGIAVDCCQTLLQTAKGMHLATSVLRNGGHIMVIDTRGEYSPMWHLIERSGGEIPPTLSFSGVKWMGGSLTNWESIAKMISRYAHIYTKFNSFIFKNRIHLPPYHKMEKAYPGFLYMGKREMRLRLKKRPDLLVMINPSENSHIIEEGSRLNIPIIALMDSSMDSSQITIPIPVNSDSLFWSTKLVTTLIKISAVLYHCITK